MVGDKQLKHSRDVLNSKCKELRHFGKGNYPYKADPFTLGELQILYDKNLLSGGIVT